MSSTTLESAMASGNNPTGGLSTIIISALDLIYLVDHENDFFDQFSYTSCFTPEVNILNWDELN